MFPFLKWCFKVLDAFQENDEGEVYVATRIKIYL